MKDKDKKEANFFIHKFREKVEIQIDIEIWTAVFFFFLKGCFLFFKAFLRI